MDIPIPDPTAELEAGLARLFRRGLDLAERVQEDAMACAAADDRARLALAFHRISRSVRQTAALRLRLYRDARSAAREAAAVIEAQAKARVEDRKSRVGTAVKELIWTEYEDADEAGEREAEFERLLEDEALGEAFTTEPVAAQIARLARAVGLSIADPAAPAADPAPDGATEAPDPGAWWSSA